jgi:carboxylate-amine ligase
MRETTDVRLLESPLRYDVRRPRTGQSGRFRILGGRDRAGTIGAAMHIPFHASPGASLGIEVELGIVDLETRELVGAATDVLGEVGRGHPDGEHPKAKHELFQSSIEIITGVCATVPEARADLEATLAEVRAAAGARGLDLMCSGTHPVSHWRAQDISPHPRYERLIEQIQWPARRLAIHGIHFHVGVRSAEKAVAIANSLAVHLPLFLGLSASSPYWHGMDTGMASCRTKVFEGLPTAGLPPQLRDWDDFEYLMQTLVRAQAIQSIREIWWDVRPHPDFGTVELRMCDGMSNLGEVAAVAAVAQSLVHHLDGLVDAGQPLPAARDWVIRENKWLAARHGLDGPVIVDDRGNLRPMRDVIGELLDTLAPAAVELECASELAAARRMLSALPGYARQRRIVESGGQLTDVVDHLVAELAAGEPLEPA